MGTVAALAACGVPGLRVTGYTPVPDVADTDRRLH
jgi:spermidine/putrescine transport system substrate-binding protein